LPIPVPIEGSGPAPLNSGASRLFCDARVVESADALTRIIMDTYLAANLTIEEVRARWIERNVDPLRDFGEACREELRIFGKI